MALQLGDTAPDFTLDSTQGEIQFHNYIDESWVIFFSHPADFTPVCTTELGEFAKRAAEFERRNAKLIGLSVDSVVDHQAWSEDIKEVTGCAPTYPILADPNLEVAKRYDMVHPKADPKLTVRTVFIIDPAKKIRLTLTYPPSAGRNVDEVLRVLDSLQLTDQQKVVTPVNWQRGKDVIVVPSLSDEDAEQHFPQGWKSAKPYLRWVEDPSG